MTFGEEMAGYKKAYKMHRQESPRLFFAKNGDNRATGKECGAENARKATKPRLRAIPAGGVSWG